MSVIEKILDKNIEFECGSLCVMASSSCNLLCKFCYLDKSKTYHAQDKIIKDAWETGAYIETIKKIYTRLHTNPLTTQRLEIWGGETLLHISEIAKSIPALLQFCPNIKSFQMSSNFTVNVDKFVDFLQVIDDNAKQSTEVSLQLSIDSTDPDLRAIGHNVELTTYMKNLKILIDKLNQTNFKYVTLEMHTHPVLSKTEYYKRFNEDESFVKYMKDYSDFQSALVRYIHNNFTGDPKIITFYDGLPFPVSENCTNDSTYEGLEFAEAIRYSDTLIHTYFPGEMDNPLTNAMTAMNEVSYISHSNAHCGQLYASFTILPNGDVIQCSSDQNLQSPEYEEECKDNPEKSKNAQLARNNSINLLTCSDEELERFKWYIMFGRQDNFSTYANLYMALMYELSLSRQVPYIYSQDPRLLYDVYRSVSPAFSCMRDNEQATHIPFLIQAGQIRKYLNGAYQYLHDKNLYNLKEQQLLNCNPNIRKIVLKETNYGDNQL